MTLANHSNVSGVWATMEIDGDNVESVMVVETDLCLNAQDGNYDLVKVNTLVAAVMAFVNGNSTIDRARIIPELLGSQQPTIASYSVIR